MRGIDAAAHVAESKVMKLAAKVAGIADKTIGAALGVAAKAFEILIAFFDPGPPKTRREIEHAIEEHDRHAASNEKDRHEAQRHETQVSDHERIAEISRQQQQRDEQRDKDLSDTEATTANDQEPRA